MKQSQNFWFHMQTKLSKLLLLLYVVVGTCICIGIKNCLADKCDIAW